MQRDILITWFFNHPQQHVWDCLTDPVLVSEWLMKNNFKPIVGHRFTFVDKPVPGWDGIVYCEVQEVVPPTRLVYSWKGGPKPGSITLDTILTWTLTAKNGGTELVLEHKGFTGWKNYIASIMMEKGWKKHVIKRFTAILNQNTDGKK